MSILKHSFLFSGSTKLSQIQYDETFSILSLWEMKKGWQEYELFSVIWEMKIINIPEQQARKRKYSPSYDKGWFLEKLKSRITFHRSTFLRRTFYKKPSRKSNTLMGKRTWRKTNIDEPHAAWGRRNKQHFAVTKFQFSIFADMIL